MPKDAERNYLRNMGPTAPAFSLGKPFTADQCAIDLIGIGTVMALLPPPPARIVDLGCGAGWTSVFLAKRGYDVLGIDISADMIAVAEENRRLNAPGAKLRFLCADYEQPIEGGFDAALFYDCLHHAEDERAALATAYAALKPGGMVVTHEPGEGHADSPESRDVVARLGVNERDMPPWLIIKTGRELGFVEPEIFPYGGQVLAFFYGRSRLGLGLRGQLGRFRSMLAWLRMHSDRASGIVRMRKPLS